MYYMFTKRLTDTDKYIGICFCWNGIKCDSVGELNKLCAAEISRWIQNGDLVEISEKGEIVTLTGELYKKMSVIELLTRELRYLINSSSLVFSDLPPLDYGRSQTESKTMKLDNDQEINEAVNNYNTVYVTSNLQSVSLNGAASKLRKSYEENETLREEVNRLTRAKKQTLTVSILGGFLALAAIAIIGVMDSSDQKSKKIEGLENKIVDLESTNKGLEADTAAIRQTLALTSRNFQFFRNKSEALTNQVANLNQEIQRKDRDLANLNTTIANLNRDLAFYKKRVSNLESIVYSSRSNQYAPENWEVYAHGGNKAHIYYQSGSKYVKTDSYFNDFANVTVYLKKDGFALTHCGFVRMMDIRKK